jgi:hypothetical protein
MRKRPVWGSAEKSHDGNLLSGLVTVVVLCMSAALIAQPERMTVNQPLPTDLLLSLIGAETAAADPAQKQVGPIPSSSPDSGTCGNDWATDTFTRYFQIKQNKDGTSAVYESFKDGTFVTNPGLSPGNCDNTDGTPPGLLNAGVTGQMHGYLLTNVTCDPVAGCPANPSCGLNNVLCQTTNDFITTFFGVGAIRNDQAFFFHYVGNDGQNQMLVEHEWKNASINRGGNHGDIASCYAPTSAVVPLALCGPQGCNPNPCP